MWLHPFIHHHSQIRLHVCLNFITIVQINREVPDIIIVI